jgi:FkbM family methyltransferase
MSLKHALKMSALRLGIEINRYDASASAEARLFRLLETQHIDTIIDVGANDGGYGQLLRRGGYAGSIVSFEPLEQEHARLVAHANSDDKWFVAPRMALGAENREIEIHVAGNSASSSILPMNQLHESANPASRYVGVQRAPMRRLEEVSHRVIDDSLNLLLKIDTQGYEMSVLEGAQKLLPRVCGVQLELSVTQLYDGQVLYLEMLEWLQALGFNLWSVIPGFVDRSSGRMLQFDGVLFRSND